MEFGSIISIQEQNRIPWFGKQLSSTPSKIFKSQPSARGWWLVLFRYKRDPPSTRKLALRWINASKYCDILNKVKDTVPHKRPGLLNEAVISQGNMTTPLRTLQVWLAAVSEWLQQISLRMKAAEKGKILVPCGSVKILIYVSKYGFHYIIFAQNSPINVH